MISTITTQGEKIISCSLVDLNVSIQLSLEIFTESLEEVKQRHAECKQTAISE